MNDRQTSSGVAAEARRIAEESLAISAENNRMLKELHAALMEPLPGYSKSFVERATEVVVNAEAGRIVGERLVWYAKVFTALGTVSAAFYAMIHWGKP